MRGPATEVERPGAPAAEAAACAVSPVASGRWVVALVGAVMALAAGGAYALGWVGETTLVVVFIGFVLFARVKLGGFG